MGFNCATIAIYGGRGAAIATRSATRIAERDNAH